MWYRVQTATGAMRGAAPLHYKTLQGSPRQGSPRQDIPRDRSLCLTSPPAGPTPVLLRMSFFKVRQDLMRGAMQMAPSGFTALSLDTCHEEKVSK